MCDLSSVGPQVSWFAQDSSHSSSIYGSIYFHNFVLLGLLVVLLVFFLTMTAMESTPLIQSNNASGTTTSTTTSSTSKRKQGHWRTATTTAAVIAVLMTMGLVLSSWVASVDKQQSVASPPPRLPLLGHGHHHDYDDNDKLIHQILQQLDQAMEGSVLFPTTDGHIFDQAWKAWNELAANQVPIAVVQVANGNDVVQAVPVLVSSLYTLKMCRWYYDDKNNKNK